MTKTYLIIIKYCEYADILIHKLIIVIL